MNKFLLSAAFFIVLFITACSTGRKDDWDRLRVTTVRNKEAPKFGEGLEGRAVNGRKVYTVLVDFNVSTEGMV